MVVDDPSQDPKLPPDARLDSLELRLKHAQRQEELRSNRQEGDQAYQIGQRVLGHLIGGPIGGGLVGWGLDSLFGTFPTFFLVLLFVGFGVGIRNVMRISKSPPGAKPR